MGKVEKLFCRILLMLLLLQCEIGWMQEAVSSPDFIESTCFSSIFWMKLNKSFLQKKFFKIEVIDPSGVPFLVDQMLGARCGYTLSKDVWGNPIFRASFLGCHVINEKDERFSLTVHIKVSLFEDLRTATVYQHPMHCSYFSWAPREILCEENYMEVSIKTDVPGISDPDTGEWMSALPEAQKVMYQMWSLMFYSSSGIKSTRVTDAEKLGYSFNNTLARVFLRSPYSTNETQNTVVNGVAVSTISSMSRYRQRWLLLLIDTTVSCPVDGTSFTDTSLMWTIPMINPRLVLQESTFRSLKVSMGINGEKIENPEKFNYTLEHNITHIGVTIPIGAPRGRLQSTVSNSVYGVTYSIDVLMEHSWTDSDWQLTKYLVIKPITIPFLPRIPIVINNTVPETRIFDIFLGVFLPDVNLVTLKIGDVTFSLKEAEQNGYRISAILLLNGTRGFELEVPFDDPNVLKEYMNINETRYHLQVIYTLTVGPDEKLYHHPADIECIMADVQLPEGIGYCDKENIYLEVTIAGLFQYWVLYVGNTLLDHITARTNGYFITTNDTHLLLQVPLFAPGIIYEEVSFERIQARFDLDLKKMATLETLNTFSIRCNFQSSEFIVCYPNGTITVLAHMKTVPSIDMGKTRLKDNVCKPREYTKNQALFQFQVSTCGTSLMFNDEHLIYENEISFEKETLPIQNRPIITRDPEYRLTVLCYYPIKETLMQSAMFYGSSSRTLPFGSGTMMSWPNSKGLIRTRQVLNIQANMFKDESFTETYKSHSLVFKGLWEPLFFEVELKDEAPNVELFLENCWMTQSEEINSMPHWNFIAYGCETKSYGSVIFSPVTASNRIKYPNHFKRVRIQNLTLPLTEVYLHCTANIGTCLRVPSSGLPCKPCPPGTIIDQHSEIYPNHHGYVVLGPVFLLQPEQFKQLNITRNKV
ncbi:uncharacterized protein LOC120310638 isoform X1 [Crotalus tigris]|uniref:uncharacterized protein LOC120310638 isoform X1 n=2 Tax=Crotalus tigris TaxID=88082 RepID=UPI00192F13A6|nr:uncharacterized protein LOC120310638 isoform X1 [Crotalus tigris]